MRSIGMLLLPLAAIGVVALRHQTVESRAPAAGDAAHMTAEQRRETFHFVGVAPGDQDVIRAAVAASRPEARRLIAIVDGLVEIRVGSAGAGSLGTTRSRPGGFDVTLDLGTVAQTIGERGIRRLVLHELGHVVDFALVPRDLAARLDAGIPAGWGCDDGQTGACAAPQERFAETFAKWATGDIGVNIYAGYKVPPPEPSLEAWGAPLAALAER